MNEQEQFLADLEPKDQANVLETPLAPTEPEEKKEVVEEVPDELKNRRHRRLEEKNQLLREENIQLAAKLSAFSESKKFREESEPAEYLKGIERIYGTDSPEAAEATALLTKSLQNLESTAAKRALELFREEQRKRDEELKREETRLDTMVEEIEDEHNVDLSNPDTRKGFFKMLERMSPKDSEGNILHYADHHAVWEEYKSKVGKKPENRAKDLSARSMVTSGSVSESKLQEDSDLRFLRENNLI